jgi:hypothetical protein
MSRFYLQELQTMADSSKKRDFGKLKVSDDMIDYVIATYGNKWDIEDEIVDLILEELWKKYGNKKVAKG